VDRVFLAGYVPRLQGAGQLVRFMLDRAGGNIPSPAILGRVGRAYVDAIDRFALDNEIPVVRFKRHQRKEDIARPYFEAAEREGRFGVVLIGVAQEKASAWRGWRDGGNDAHPHFEFGRQAVFVNHYYFYIPGLSPCHKVIDHLSLALVVLFPPDFRAFTASSFADRTTSLGNSLRIACSVVSSCAFFLRLGIGAPS